MSHPDADILEAYLTLKTQLDHGEEKVVLWKPYAEIIAYVLEAAMPPDVRDSVGGAADTLKTLSPEEYKAKVEAGKKFKFAPGGNH
jgi:hypothetical protein